MQNLFPQMIQFNVPFIFTILIAVTAAAVTVFYYRRTNPEVSNAGKYALGVLRGSIIFLIILLFFAPRFLLQIRKVEKPKIAVFADNSLSMGNSESDSTRWDDEQPWWRIAGFARTYGLSLSYRTSGVDLFDEIDPFTEADVRSGLVEQSTASLLPANASAIGQGRAK